MPGVLHPELRALLDRWVGAIEAKDVAALAQVFRCEDENLAVFWSNGERSHGWNEVRQHIEADFRQDVDLAMTLHDVRATALGEQASVLTYRYDITVTEGKYSVKCRRHASMTVCRDAEGWRVATLHVSTMPRSK